MRPDQLPTDDLLVLGGDSVSARQIPDLARAVARAMEAHPQFLPTRAGPGEPLRSLSTGFRAFTEAELERAVGRPFRILFGGPLHELHGTLDIFPDNMLDRAPRTHKVDASVPLDDLDAQGREAFAAWAIDLFDALEVFAGFVTTADMQAQRKAMISRATARGEMAAPRWDDALYTTLDREVSDVYWVNYFGPAFIERWGLDRLQGLGVRTVVRPTGAIAIWVTEAVPTVDPGARRLSDYAFKRVFYDVLGERTFTRESLEEPEPGEVVPTLHDHRRAVGVRTAPPHVGGASD